MEGFWLSKFKNNKHYCANITEWPQFLSDSRSDLCISKWFRFTPLPLIQFPFGADSHQFWKHGSNAYKLHTVLGKNWKISVHFLWGSKGIIEAAIWLANQPHRAFIRLNLQPLALLTLSGHHWSSSPKETGLWTGMLFLSKLASPSRLVEPRSVSNEAPSSHRRSRNLNTDSRSRNSSESRSKGRRRTGMQ